MSNPTKYTAIYRNGGTDNFSWHRVMNPTTLDIATADAAILARGGRPAYVIKADDEQTLRNQRLLFRPMFR